MKPRCLHVNSGADLRCRVSLGISLVPTKAAARGTNEMEFQFHKQAVDDIRTPFLTLNASTSLITIAV
jgi:hypothetical protein